MDAEPKTRLERLEEAMLEIDQTDDENDQYMDSLLEKLQSRANQLSESMRAEIEKAIVDYKETGIIPKNRIV